MDLGNAFASTSSIRIRTDCSSHRPTPGTAASNTASRGSRRTGCSRLWARRAGPGTTLPESDGRRGGRRRDKETSSVSTQQRERERDRDTGDWWTDGGEKDGHGALRESGRAVKTFPRRPELGLRDSGELGNGILQTFGVGSFPEERFLLQLVLRGCNKGYSQSVVSVFAVS